MTSPSDSIFSSIALWDAGRSGIDWASLAPEVLPSIATALASRRPLTLPSSLKIRRVRSNRPIRSGSEIPRSLGLVRPYRSSMLTMGRPIRQLWVDPSTGEAAFEEPFVGGEGSGDDPLLGRVVMRTSCILAKSPFQPDALDGSGYNGRADGQPHSTHRSILA